jgi:hypothetical protein
MHSRTGTSSMPFEMSPSRCCVSSATPSGPSPPIMHRMDRYSDTAVELMEAGAQLLRGEVEHSGF